MSTAAHDLTMSEPMISALADQIAARLTAPQPIQTITFGELWKLYYDRKVRIFHKSEDNTKYWWAAHGNRWQALPVGQIKRLDVQAWVDDLAKESPSAAWRAVSVMSAVITWGLKRDYLPTLTNPCIGVEKPRTRPRTRFLKPGELRRFVEAIQLEAPLYRDLFALALLTGARKGNLISMRWADIDTTLASWTIPANEFKNGEEHITPLDTEALAILGRRKSLVVDSPWVFPAPGKAGHVADPKRAWARIIKRAQLEDFRIHDLRRTLGSYLAIKGQSAYIIGKMLGHKDPRSTAVYARLDLASVRQGLSAVKECWSELMSQPHQEQALPRITAAKAKPPAGERPKNRDARLSPREQVIVEAKILTAMQWGGTTRKDFYRKIGSQVQLNADELGRVLAEMEAKGLVVSEVTAGNIIRYKLAG